MNSHYNNVKAFFDCSVIAQDMENGYLMVSMQNNNIKNFGGLNDICNVAINCLNDDFKGINGFGDFKDMANYLDSKLYFGEEDMDYFNSKAITDKTNKNLKYDKIELLSLLAISAVGKVMTDFKEVFSGNNRNSIRSLSVKEVLNIMSYSAKAGEIMSLCNGYIAKSANRKFKNEVKKNKSYKGGKTSFTKKVNKFLIKFLADSIEEDKIKFQFNKNKIYKKQLNISNKSKLARELVHENNAFRQLLKEFKSSPNKACSYGNTESLANKIASIQHLVLDELQERKFLK